MSSSILMGKSVVNTWLRATDQAARHTRGLPPRTRLRIVHPVYHGLRGCACLLTGRVWIRCIGKMSLCGS